MQKKVLMDIQVSGCNAKMLLCKGFWPTLNQAEVKGKGPLIFFSLFASDLIIATTLLSGPLDNRCLLQPFPQPKSCWQQLL